MADEIPAKIVLSNDAFSKIDYLTRHYTNEIAAVGTVSIEGNKVGEEGKEDVERYFYIKDLFFPYQEVSLANIKIKPEMYTKGVIKEVGVDHMGDIAFYWHKHPNGSATHSQTDKDDTFDTLISSVTAKPYYLFLQTSIGNDGELLTEARIEMRTPIRTTIPDACIDLVQQLPTNNGDRVPRGFGTPITELWKLFEADLKKLDLTKEEIDERREEYLGLLKNYHSTFKIKSICDKIVAEKVVEPTITSTYSDATGYWDGSKWCPYSDNRSFHRCHSHNTTLNHFKGKKKDRGFTDIDSLSKMFIVEEEGNYIDNTTVNSINTTKDEWASLDFKNGGVRILTGKFFDEILRRATAKKNKKDGKPGALFSLLNTKHLTREKTKKGMMEWKLQPNKQAYYPLREAVKNLFVGYNK